METWVWVMVIAAVAVVAVVARLLSRKARSRGLQRDFGSEYERTMARAGDRGVAEADLLERRDRVSALDVRPLSQAGHDRFATEWTKVQAEFVDAPSEASPTRTS